MGRRNLCRCLQAPVLSARAQAASSMLTTANYNAEPQPLSHFAEAPSSCGSIEAFVIAHIPLAADTLAHRSGA